MGMSAFPHRDGTHGAGVDTAQMVLEPQQAVLLEALRRANGEPVSYDDLQQAGIALPASVVSELELAGVPIERSMLKDGRSIGVRLGRSVDAQGLPERAPHAMGGATAQPASPVGSAGDLLRHLSSEYARRGWAAVIAVLDWLRRNVPPATRQALQWLSRTARAAGVGAKTASRRGLNEGARRGRAAGASVLAWLTLVVPPATRASVRWLSRNGRAAGELAHHAARELADANDAARKRLAQMRLERQAPREITVVRWPPRRTAPHRLAKVHAPAKLRRPSRQARNRCVALGALAAVSAAVLAVILSDLNASTGTGHTRRTPHSRQASAARR